jgi:hypothetical protein
MRSPKRRTRRQSAVGVVAISLATACSSSDPAGAVADGPAATANVVVKEAPIEFVCAFHDNMTGTITPVTSSG